jgi:hypothetical protein
MIKSGAISLEPIAVKDLTKNELYDLVAGKIDIDFEEFWILVCKENGNDIKNEKISCISEQSKAVKRK